MRPLTVNDIPIEVLAKIIGHVVPLGAQYLQSDKLERKPCLPFHPQLFFVNRCFRDIAREQFYAVMWFWNFNSLEGFAELCRFDERIGKCVRRAEFSDFEYVGDPS